LRGDVDLAAERLDDVLIDSVGADEVDVGHALGLADAVSAVLALQAHFQVKAVAVVDDRLGLGERQAVAAGAWVTDKKRSPLLGSWNFSTIDCRSSASVSP